MEEVSFNSHGTGFVIVNGQAVLLQKDTEVNSINGINEEIFQRTLNAVNISNSSKDIECLQDALPVNNSIADLAENGFVIVSDEQKLNNSKMIQLSLEQANELGIRFSMNNESVKEEAKQMENCEDILSQQYFFQEPIEQGSAVCEINSNNGTDVADTLDLNSYNDLLQLPTLNVNDNLAQQITLVPQYINGQITYTLQIGEEINNSFELAQVPNIGNGTSLAVPTVSVLAQQPSMEKLPSNVVKCTTPTSLHSEGSSLDKVVSNNVVQCNGASDSSSNLAVSTLGKDQQVNAFVIPNKVITMNTKPRILASTKSCNRNVLSNATKVDTGKSIHPKVHVSASKGQSLLISNQRNIAPLKVPLPALTSSNDKNEEIIVSTNQRPIVYKRLNPSKPIVPSKMNNNVIKQQLVSVSTRPSCKLNESTLSLKVPSVPLLQNTSQIQTPKVLKVTEGLATQKSDSVYVNGAKPARRLTQSQLKQIATVLQKNRNNQAGFSSPSTLYDTETNTRIICRVVYPEDFVGRVENRVSLAKKRGRPSKCKGPVTETVCEKKPINEERKKQALSRTRSGRLSRPPRHMIKDYKRLQGDDSDDPYSDYVSETEDNSENPAAVNLLPGLSLRQKRNISSEFRCPTCNKIYLGHQRMRWHFTKYPDHGNEKHLQSLNIPEIDGNSTVEGGNNSKSTSLYRRGIGWGRGRGKVKRLHPDLSLKEVLKNYKETEIVEGASETVARALSGWELLLLRLEATSNGKSKVATLCDELNNIVQRIRQVAENIFQPEIVGGNIGETFQLEDDILAHIFGIPKGSYIVNDVGLETLNMGLKKDEKPNDVANNADEPALSESKRCKIEELQTNTATGELQAEESGENRCESSFLLNSEMLCDKSFNSSDKSGIESVDQIVSERLKTLAPVDDIMSSLSALPDTNRSLVSSDDLMAGLLTSVESMSTQSLTDSIFTSPNESRLTNRTHVSASTEDLMKSLENLSREINGDDSHSSTLPTTDLDFTVLSQEFATGR